MLQSRSSSRTLAKNRSNSPSPSSRLGRLFPPFGRNSVMPSLGSNLLCPPVELGSIDPHAMQNDGELTRDRNLGLSEPVALGEPYPQAFTADVGSLFADTHQINGILFGEAVLAERARNPNFMGCLPSAPIRRNICMILISITVVVF